MERELAAIVMAGGLGTRMRSSRPKHLHRLLGRRLVDWVLEAARSLAPAPLVLVCSPSTRDELAATIGSDVAIVVQHVPRGTGDAVACARAALAGFEGDVIVLSGDTPLLTEATLAALVAAHRQTERVATILSFELDEPGAYGRVVRDGSGAVRAIVEAKDADERTLAVRELNSSIYVFRSRELWPALQQLDSENAQGELYLTDTVAWLTAAGKPVGAVRAESSEDVEGVNTQAELACAAAALRTRILAVHQRGGVAIVDPATTWIEPEVEIGADAVIHPFVVLRGQTRVGAGAEIGPHAIVEDAVVAPGQIVPPLSCLSD